MIRLYRRRFLEMMGTTALGAILLGTGCQRQDATPVSQPAFDPTAPAPIPTRAASVPTKVSKAKQAVPASPTQAPTQQAPTQAPSTSEPQAATPEPQVAVPAQTAADLAVARGDDPATITRAAIDAIGGMAKYVKAGHDVIIKPNICVSYHSFEYAATTNPVVVATLVSLCLEAGAKRVRVMDTPFGGTPESSYEASGIRDAVVGAGGRMEVMTPIKYVKLDIPEGQDIKAWEVYEDMVTADVVINVPIAKNHSLARLTLGAKNLLGVVRYPNRFHSNMGQRLADLTSLVRPTLTVIDAVRILTAHGPTGGNLADVKKMDTIIASPDIVAADTWGASLFDMAGEDISYIKACHDMGLGTMDLDSLVIAEVEA